MKTQQVTMKQKLADWELVFNSKPNAQNSQDLNGLIISLRSRLEALSSEVIK